MQATQLDEDQESATATELEDEPVEAEVSPTVAELEDLDLERALSQFIKDEYPDEDAGQTAETDAPQELPRASASPRRPELVWQLAPDEKTRKSDSDSWEQLWQQLKGRGWSVVSPCHNVNYWMPPGVVRKPPNKVRRDYFDSKKQVIRHLRDRGQLLVEVSAEEEPSRRLTARRSAQAPRASPAERPAEDPDRQASTASTASTASRVRARDAGGTAAEPVPSTDTACPQRASTKSSVAPAFRSIQALLWAQLSAAGWRKELAGKAPYFLPPGVQRGPGKKNRVDYFDSKKAVLEYVQRTRADPKRRETETKAVEIDSATESQAPAANGWLPKL